MADIIFADLLKVVRVKSVERAHMACLCSDMLAMALQCGESEKDSPLTRVLPQDCPAIVGSILVGEYLRRWLVPTSTQHLKVDDTRIDLYSLAVNTMMACGCDGMRLLARLHSTCEFHCYVEASNRRWLADIIEKARIRGVLRRDMGWKDVVLLLRRSDRSPAVVSYASTDRFPSMIALRVTGNTAVRFEEAVWDKSTIARKWDLGMEILREQSDHLELRPSTWETWRAAPGLNAFQVREWAEMVAGDEPGDCSEKSSEDGDVSTISPMVVPHPHLVCPPPGSHMRASQ